MNKNNKIAWVFPKIILVVALTAWLFSSCGDVSKRVNEKLDELSKKTESLDSLIKNHINEIIPIDSLTKKGSESLNKIDSLIN